MPKSVQVCSTVGEREGESHNQTGITKNFTSLKWVLNTAQQLVSLTNSLFLSVHCIFSSNCRTLSPGTFNRLPYLKFHYKRELSFSLYEILINLLSCYKEEGCLFLSKVHSFLPSQVYHFLAYSSFSQASAISPSSLNQPRLVPPQGCCREMYNDAP